MGERKGELLSKWYWIMPNMVLFDDNLTDKQKLLYCLISSLCAKEWFCRATNEHLWDLLNANKLTISRNISELQEKWYIEIEITSNNQRKITLYENVNGGWQNCQGGIDENINPYIYTNSINEYSFQNFWEEYPHARKGKKKDSEKYFKQNNPLEVKKQVQILKWQIKAWLQDSEWVPACERWIRDFTPLNDDVIKQKLVKICKRHLNAWWDMKQRSLELKETFGEQQINEIVKAIQQKDKSLF